MKNLIVLYIFLLFNCKCAPSAITYELNGGRFGDNLSTFCKAKLLSHKYQLPFLYKQFEYSDQLILHTTQTVYTQEHATQFEEIIYIKTEDDIKKNKNKNALLVVNFYTACPGIYEYGFNNAAFATEIKQLLSPVHPATIIEKNENDITIALHVRKGGGFDAPLASDQVHKSSERKSVYADQKWPTKFPPDQFYIDQLRTMRKLLNLNKRMIVYLFTDDPNPAQLAQRYKQKLADLDLEFRYRQKGNSHNANVVEDYYLMAQCDCMIRSTSLLAKAAQVLGNHEIIIYPITGYWVEDTLIINPVGIILRN